MELQHVNVKIYAERPEQVRQELFTPIFQQWIQNQATGELLIDVADYLHVEAGPGIVLIGNEADYSMDNSEHRLGLRYNRKAPLGGDNRAKYKQALRAALLACRRLEAEPLLGGMLSFDKKSYELFINDRALAPNTPETLKKLQPELQEFFGSCLGGAVFTLRHDPDPRVRFGVKLQSTQPLDWGQLLKKLQD